MPQNEPYGPRTALGQFIHSTKHRAPEESYDDSCVRYARAVSAGDEQLFRTVLRLRREMILLPAGRQQLAVGRPYGLTPLNCFVAPPIDDSTAAIFDSVKFGALTMRAGGGVGWDFSSLRPYGEPIRGLGAGAIASGPVSFMHVWHSMCGTMMSAGERRGAMMGILRIDHPDILRFINAKKDQTSLTNFNISVAATDEFMEALENDGLYKLRFSGTDFSDARAIDIWSVIMENAWDFAEPGIIFIDRINHLNPLWYAEKIAGTNPCFSADTLITTPHGAIPIEDLVGRAAEIWDGGKWQLIDTFRVTGHDQKMLRIELHDGSYLRVTEAHSMILDNGSRKRADQLAAGDRLQLNDTEYDGPISESGAYLKGFLAGDGTHRRAAQPLLYLYPPKYCCKERLLTSADELDVVFRTNAKDLGFVDQDTGRQLRQSMTGLAARSDTLLHWCGPFKERLPRAIFKWDRKSKCEFLAGLFDADGTALDTTNGFAYQLSSIHNSFLRDVQVLLKSIGVRSRLAIMTKAGIKPLPGGLYECQTCWRLSIAQASSIRLASQVNFARLQSFADRTCTYNVIPKAGIVISITPDGIDEKVYCCTVPDTHMVSLAIGITTGQCGEQPLPPNGACLLSSINIAKLLVRNADGTYSVDLDLLETATQASVQANDNVIDIARYPLPEQREEHQKTRRMGIGVTGVANALEICGCPYASPKYLVAQDKVLSQILHEAYRASIELAKTKGSFPLFDAEQYLAGPFIQTLPNDIRDGIRQYGIRNGLLTSIAPTGTISLAADNVSGGIEPVFQLRGERDLLTVEGLRPVAVEDFALAFYGVECRTADQVSAQEHVDVLCRAQRWVDSSISKTVNVAGQVAGQGPGVTFADFKELYLRAWQGGAKSCSTFNSTGKRMGIMRPSVEDAGAACFADPVTGLRSCAE